MLASIAIQSCTAQIKNAKTETVKVFGNCNMCKKNIETAAFNKKISTAVWDKENKTALLTYDSSQTTADAILKKIALAGYDNQNFLAPGEQYKQIGNSVAIPVIRAIAESIKEQKLLIDEPQRQVAGDLQSLLFAY